MEKATLISVYARREIAARLRMEAMLLKYSDTQWAVEALTGTFDIIDNPTGAMAPRVAMLALSARAYQADGPLLGVPQSTIIHPFRSKWW